MQVRLPVLEEGCARHAGVGVRAEGRTEGDGGHGLSWGLLAKAGRVG